MERIDGFGQTNFRTSDKEKRKLKKNKSTKTDFISLLSTAEQTTPADETSESWASYGVEQVDESSDIEEYLDQIHEIGEKVKENPALSMIKQYKQAVRNFLHVVIQRSLLVEKTKLSGFKVLKTKGQKELTIVKIIDTKLERLAAEVLQSQKDQIDLIARVDEIYGLLVDLIR
jgi:uncharacterized protein